MSVEENKSIVRRYVEAVLNKGDEATAKEVLSADFVFHIPDKDLRGLGEFRQYMEMSHSGMPDSQFTIDDVIAEADKVVFCWTLTGTHTGEFMGIPATNRKISSRGTSVIRVSGGKIVEIWPYWDRLTLMQQLGVAPKPG